MLNFGFKKKKNGIPSRSDVVFLAKWVDGVLNDTIGLSVDDYANIDTNLQPLFFGAGPVLLDIETIISNIEASEYLNDGGELVGSTTKGYALYVDVTDEMVLRQAYRFFRIAYPDVLPALNPDGSTMLNPDGSTAYNPE